MLEPVHRQLREDCLASLAPHPELRNQLANQHIAVVGGTGFVGSWLAETIAALNDDLGCNAHIHLLGRSASSWHANRRHLERADVSVHATDVRSPFELPRQTTLVLFAAGIADPRIHASDPHQVFQTNVYGLDNALAAAARLESIQRFVNLSSGLVLGEALPAQALSEHDLGLLDFTRFHNLYAESRRIAESLACAYAGQYRIPLSTARAFTFLGPYQTLDAPWALNNFIRDALMGQEIRIHGDGSTARSYLYGSDVATWLLKTLVSGRDGEVYNVGGNEAVSHGKAAQWVADRTVPTPKLLYKSRPRESGRSHAFYPDITHTTKALGVSPVFDVPAAIERSMRWHAHHIGAARFLRTGA